MTVTVLGWRRRTDATSPGLIPGNFPTTRRASRWGPVTPSDAAMRRDAVWRA